MQTIDEKKLFYVFLLLSLFRFLTFFLNFPYVFKIKNVENLLFIQANTSEI